MSDSSELSDVLHAEELMLDQFRHIQGFMDRQIEGGGGGGGDRRDRERGVKKERKTSQEEEEEKRQKDERR